MEWISVKDKLPPFEVAVLFAYWVEHWDFAMRRVGIYDANTKWYISGYEILQSDAIVSHWCYLPSKDELQKPEFD